MTTSIYRGVGKRALDLFVSGALLILFSPLLLMTAALVRATLGSPVLFRQVRSGRSGAPFVLFKLRTMKPVGGRHQPDSARVTKVGTLLRSTSLDELPSLLNVFRGDLSLVGPRPLLPEYLDRYTPRQRRRHDVKPGMTGWAQVNGRNAIPWDEKLTLDLLYVQRQSLSLDLRILLLTIGVVLFRKGISQPGHATMEAFRASPRRAGACEDSDSG